jgi:hypothetical protein
LNRCPQSQEPVCPPALVSGLHRNVCEAQVLYSPLKYSRGREERPFFPHSWKGHFPASSLAFQFLREIYLISPQ